MLLKLAADEQGRVDRKRTMLSLAKLNVLVLTFVQCLFISASRQLLVQRALLVVHSFVVVMSVGIESSMVKDDITAYV